QVFSFAEYCEEKYDSIYLIQPYDDEEEIYSLPYKMSQRLRDKCSYTMQWPTHMSEFYLSTKGQ
ncbi:MAG: hypothetical protein IKU35_07775, partial [Bacteroidaceae bacterium]|nr:hypothetical protein [Bacteroidaceae bacterium]